MKKDYYVILTGSKNNAGDYLIKYRAKKLFAAIRPDRDVVDVDGWKPFDGETLEIVNKSKALILMGGPALQEKMRPRVYGLMDELSQINVPIVSMGIGWHSREGNWDNTYDYKLNAPTLELLQRISTDGYFSSVRDYHTLNVMKSLGYSNYLMTGCPALYEEEFFNVPIAKRDEYKKVGFSLGVSFKHCKEMYRQMQEAVLEVVNRFSSNAVEVVFHHSLKDTKSTFNSLQIEFVKWLDSQNISYIDISGAAENLINYYSSCDLHIGYRVHAHIFMSSISRQSILLNEDGRGKALKDVVGGLSLNAYSTDRTLSDQFLNKIKSVEVYRPNENFIKELGLYINYELSSGVRLMQPRQNIDLHYNCMKRYLLQLP